MTRRDEFDNLLDRALSEFRDAQPIAGLEERLLRRLWLYGRPRPRPWGAAGGGAMAACAAVLLLAVALFVRSNKLHPPFEPVFSRDGETPGQSQASIEPRPALPRTRPRAPTTAVGVSALTRPRLRGVKTAAAAQPPRQAFPIPVRMTREERALVVLANAHPDVLPAGVDENQLITIAPVVIEPLAFSAGEKGDH